MPDPREGYCFLLRVCKRLEQQISLVGNDTDRRLELWQSFQLLLKLRRSFIVIAQDEETV